MLFACAYSVLRLLLDLVDVRLRVSDPEAELLLLRHQLRVVRRQVKRPHLGVGDRTIMAALSRRVSRAALVGMLVQPRRFWAGTASWCAGSGRCSVAVEVQGDLLSIPSCRG
jgi:hypothetical protein